MCRKYPFFLRACKGNFSYDFIAIFNTVFFKLFKIDVKYFTPSVLDAFFEKCYSLLYVS